MPNHGATLYPMLGVGAFMTMFWSGVVLGHELGLGCVSMLITGLLFACIASVGVCELQRRDGHGLAADARAASPTRAPSSGRPASDTPSRARADGRGPAVLGVAARLPVKSC